MSLPPAPARPHSRTYAASELAALMSAALGAEKAASVVAAAIATLRLAPQEIDAAGARRICEHLAAQGGLVGITSRVALSRLQLGTKTTPSAPIPAATPRRTLTRRPRSFVTALLTATLGEERATTLVRETADAMRLPNELELDQALALLEKITKMSGVVGVAARFAMSRIHLSF
jgi:hypothetical protein